MDKQEYLIKLLETLSWVREPAEGFLIAIQSWGFDEKIVDMLISLIDKAIKDTDDSRAQEVLKWSLWVLEKLKKAEAEDAIHDAEDCDELLQQIENLL